MTDYISREAVNALIKAECSPKVAAYLNDCVATIPAADVRPVVLCKDCKWTKTDGMEGPAIYCMQWDRWETPPDGFCWLGEKREA